MAARLHDGAGVEDHDGVGRSDRGQAVGDDDGGPAGREAVDGPLDGGLGFRVEGARGLVEEEDSRVPYHGPGQCNPLLLPT